MSISTEKFFIPFLKPDADLEKADNSITSFVAKELGAELSNRRIQRLAWHHEGKDLLAVVGDELSINGEVVMMILYDKERNLYYVCTLNRGVARGMPILAGGDEVRKSVDFER